MEPELKSCGVLVVRGNPIDSFLLMKHPDRWDLPKGHVDPGETEYQCAMRELVEETGITAGDIQFVPNFRYESQYYVQNRRSEGIKKLKTLVIFLGHLVSDVKITVTEHYGYQWFNWNPPHSIQQQTIDPLLKQLQDFLDNAGKQK